MPATDSLQNRSYENILATANRGADDQNEYRIMAPLQITVEYCSGMTEDDYYNILMFSPRQCWFRGNRNDALFHNLSAREPHKHDYFELLLVLQGEMIQQIEGQDYLYRAGTCCLINRSILHTERFIGQTKVCFIGMSVDFIKTLLAEDAARYFTKLPGLRENDIIRFMTANMGAETTKEYQDLFPARDNLTGIESLHDLTDSLIRIMLDPGPGADYDMKGAFCRLLDYLQKEYYATPVHLSAGADNVLFLRIRRLLEDTDGRMSRAELARLLHYNGSYLNTVVHRHTGMCLFDYGMTFCFEKAEQLLAESELSVSEIAAALKFSNRTHFYALFREHYGMTPQQWRKSRRTAGE